MPDVICSDVCLWIKDVGCGGTRRTFLALEPGSRIWLDVEGTPVLFERMQDGTDGRSTRGMNAVGGTRDAWLRIYRQHKNSMVAIEIVERPLDAGASAIRWLDPHAGDTPTANER